MVPYAPLLRYPYCGTLANHVNAVDHLESRGLLEIIEVSGTFCSINRLDLLVSLDKRIPFERCQSALPTMYFYCVCIPLLNSWLDIANYSHVQHTIVSSYTDLPADSSRESYVESDDTTGLVLSESSTSIERIALISTLR